MRGRGFCVGVELSRRLLEVEPHGDLFVGGVVVVDEAEGLAAGFDEAEGLVEGDGVGVVGVDLKGDELEVGDGAGPGDCVLEDEAAEASSAVG